MGNGGIPRRKYPTTGRYWSSLSHCVCVRVCVCVCLCVVCVCVCVYDQHDYVSHCVCVCVCVCVWSHLQRLTHQQLKPSYNSSLRASALRECVLHTQYPGNHSFLSFFLRHRLCLILAMLPNSHEPKRRTATPKRRRTCSITLLHNREIHLRPSSIFF